MFFGPRIPHSAFRIPFRIRILSPMDVPTDVLALVALWAPAAAPLFACRRWWRATRFRRVTATPPPRRSADDDDDDAMDEDDSPSDLATAVETEGGAGTIAAVALLLGHYDCLGPSAAPSLRALADLRGRRRVAKEGGLVVGWWWWWWWWWL